MTIFLFFFPADGAAKGAGTYIFVSLLAEEWNSVFLTCNYYLLQLVQQKI